MMFPLIVGWCQKVMMHMTSDFFLSLCLFISYVVVLLGILHLGYPFCEVLASTNLHHYLVSL